MSLSDHKSTVLSAADSKRKMDSTYCADHILPTEVICPHGVLVLFISLMFFLDGIPQTSPHIPSSCSIIVEN